MSVAHRAAFLSGGWTRGGTSEVVRRAHPASGAQWNVQVVRGKVNGKCLWNACKALSLGLLLMVLGAAMATIGYYADQLSVAQEIRGNHTVAVKNESRGFHLNNLSYAGPIVMGVGGFIVVAACVMTFEARDSAAKVVPARFKMSTTGPPSGSYQHNAVARSGHGSLRTSGSQTATNVGTSTHHGQYAHRGSLHGAHHGDHHGRHHHHIPDRHNLTQSFVQFSRGLGLESRNFSNHKYVQGTSPSGTRSSSLKVPQGSINRSPSAPDLVFDKQATHGVSGTKESTSPSTAGHHKSPITGHQSSRRTFAACALLNPGLLNRHALSVDEAAGNYKSNESLQHGTGSQGSMAMDLHLEAVTLKIRDKRRNPLKRQRKIEEDEHKHENNSTGSRRNSHSHSPRLSGQCHLTKDGANGGSAQYLPSQSISHHSCHKTRRSSNASDCSHRSRSRRRESVSCHQVRGKLERAISSDSRLPSGASSSATGAIPKCYHSHEPSRHNSTEQETQEQIAGTSTSDNDIRKSHHVMVHFSPTTDG
ncbi:filaggrin [Anthonomus grandis grandis]|uniref:filaggrin n=1 Tax=Anthonomus grandis grandis TaxID=2921223 RepID=UPI00216667E3|nr:filaggrin [Anthonomus grandis grandis]